MRSRIPTPVRLADLRIADPRTADALRIAVVLAIAIALAVANGCGRGPAGKAPAPNPDLKALVAAERTFAGESVKLGVRAAFMGWLADDAILFRPRIVTGGSYLERMPAKSGAVLDWQPTYAAVARSGDLGYTTGPWTWRNSLQDTVSSWGEYVSVWRKLPDGRWRVAVDLGVPHGKPAGPPPALTYPDDGRFPKAAGAGAGAGAGAESEVRAAEAAFDARATAAGADSAYLEYGSPALRLYRAGEGPVLGPRNAATTAKQMDATVRTIRQMGARISRDGDLGCVWGETDGVTGRGNPGLSTWLRIWNRGPDGAWKLVVDVSLIVPLEQPRE